MRRFLNLLSVMMLGFAGATVAQNVDPTGIYRWEVNAHGTIVMGQFVIEGEVGAWKGRSESDVGVAPITRVDVDGNMVLLSLDGGADLGEIVIELTMDGDEFFGTGSASTMDFEIIGNKSDT